MALLAGMGQTTELEVVGKGLQSVLGELGKTVRSPLVDVLAGTPGLHREGSGVPQTGGYDAAAR